MPFAITCPGCGKSYNLPANVQGKKVRCVKCRAEFIVGAAAPPQPPTEDFAEVELAEAPSFREELNKLASAPSRSAAKTSPAPRRAKPEPQSTGSFLIPLVCICVFF